MNVEENQKASRSDYSQTVFSSPLKPVSARIVDQDYIQKLNVKLTKTDFPASFVLIEYSSLILELVSIRCTKNSDALVYMNKHFSQQLQVYKCVQTSCKVNLELQSVIDKKIPLLEKSFGSIKKLIEAREELNKHLTGAFPFADRKLLPTFVCKFNQHLQTDMTEFQLIDFLRAKRSQIEDKAFPVSSESEQLFNFFAIQIEYFKNQQKYKSTSCTKLSKAITNLLGPEPTSSDISLVLNSNELIATQTENLQQQEEVKMHIRNFVRENSNKISDTMIGIAENLVHPEFLQYLRSFSFLEQICIYKQMCRDLAKTALVEGNISQQNAPPGLNTTIKFTSGGTLTLFVGDLGTYKEIGINNTETLRNYFSYLLGISDAVENEVAFKVLHQVESVRDIAAILTIPMFFKMAASEFTPDRKGGTQYNFKQIATQMPMAMEKAVSGAVYINLLLEEELEYYKPYDYRAKGDKNSGQMLNNKNNNLLFDYILFSINSLNQEAEKLGYTIEDFTYKQEKESIVSIDSFPLKILTDLIGECYSFDSSQHIDLSGNIDIHLEPEIINI